MLPIDDVIMVAVEGLDSEELSWSTTILAVMAVSRLLVCLKTNKDYKPRQNTELSPAGIVSCPWIELWGFNP